MSLNVDSKKEAWREHYMHRLNVEFSWNPGGLSEVCPVEGSSEHITIAIVRKAINKMKGKAAGPSGIVAEMLKAAGSSGASMIRDLIEDIIFGNHIPSEWKESHIVSVYKGKGDALNRSNYRGLKLIDQVMKVLERVVEGFIRQRVVINDIQCGFMQSRGTTDTIFILRQLQEKHLVAGKPLYLAFIDLENAFDRVPREVIWWSMRKLKIDEWLVRIVQSMYKEVRSRVRVGDEYSNSFDVRVGVYQGSVLSPLLIVIVLEALSMEFRTGCPREILYADDLRVSAQSMDELLVKLRTWRSEMEKKGLRVNMGKTKLMVSGSNDNVCSHSLFSKLGIQDVELVLRTSRMRWFGYVGRSVGWISQVRKLDLDICKKSGRPKKTRNELILNDKRKLDMVCADPLDRSEWKGRLRDRNFKSPTLGKGKRAIKRI